MVVIADNIEAAACRSIIAIYASRWVQTKEGRKAKPLDEFEMGLYYSDGKLAVLMWIDPFPAPVGESKFAPASGEVPGLKG
jgi:hypothetical protein